MKAATEISIKENSEDCESTLVMYFEKSCQADCLQNKILEWPYIWKVMQSRKGPEYKLSKRAHLCSSKILTSNLPRRCQSRYFVIDPNNVGLHENSCLTEIHVSKVTSGRSWWSGFPYAWACQPHLIHRRMNSQEELSEKSKQCSDVSWAMHKTTGTATHQEWNLYTAVLLTQQQSRHHSF